MTKEKFSAQDIVSAIVSQAGVTRAAAEEFFRAWMSVTEEALLSGDTLKIKKFGTFRVVWIGPRKSVNVQTGEDIQLEGYRRVVFTPDKELKERVNEPYAHLETVSLDETSDPPASVAAHDPLTTLSEQAGEIKELLSEIKAMPVSDAPLSEESAPSSAEPAPQTEPAEDYSTPPAPSVTQVKVSAAPAVSFHIPTERRRRRAWPYVLGGVILIAASAVAAYFAIMPVQHWVNRHFFGHDTAAYDALHEQWMASTQEAEEVLPLPTKVEEAVVDSFLLAFESRTNSPRQFITVQINAGSRLAYLAEKHYGSPYFWVYIYEANRETISDPDQVEVGTIVHIPDLPFVLIDPRSQRALDAANSLAKRYKKQ